MNGWWKHLRAFGRAHPRTSLGRSWRKPFLAVGALLVAIGLAGCAGGGQADDADASLAQIDGVADASTSYSRPGVPWNLEYWSYVELEPELTVERQAEVVDQALVIARDTLGPTTNYEYTLTAIGADGFHIELDTVLPLIGEVGPQDGVKISLSADALRAYASPTEDEAVTVSRAPSAAQVFPFAMLGILGLLLLIVYGVLWAGGAAVIQAIAYWLYRFDKPADPRSFRTYRGPWSLAFHGLWLAFMLAALAVPAVSWFMSGGLGRFVTDG